MRRDMTAGPDEVREPDPIKLPSYHALAIPRGVPVAAAKIIITEIALANQGLSTNGNTVATSVRAASIQLLQQCNQEKRKSRAPFALTGFEKSA